MSDDVQRMSMAERKQAGEPIGILEELAYIRDTIDGALTRLVERQSSTMDEVQDFRWAVHRLYNPIAERLDSATLWFLEQLVTGQLHDPDTGRPVRG